MPDHNRRSSGGSKGASDSEDSSLVEAPPEPPRLNPQLPAHPDEFQKSAAESMSYSKAALGSTAVSALVMPIVVLCLGGYWLDMRWKHATPWISMIGVIVGLVLGVTSMLKVLEKMSK